MNARIAGATFLVYITAVMCFAALLLGVTLLALTRHADWDIALMKSRSASG